MIQYQPTFHCQACGRRAIRDGLKAWFFQPPMPTNGRGDSPGKRYFVCSTCKSVRKGRKR